MAKKIPGADPSAPGEKTHHVAVASVKDTSEDDVAKLRAQVAALSEQLQVARSEAEQKALAVAEAQTAFMQRDIQEIPTGKSVIVQRCSGYKTVSYRDDGRPILKPVWEDVELPTYFYKIDLPPVGGEGLIPNGVPFYHGTVYEVDIDTLRSWKEMVFRLWDHERNIRGSNENFYRRETAPTISASGRRA